MPESANSQQKTPLFGHSSVRAQDLSAVVQVHWDQGVADNPSF